MSLEDSLYSQKLTEMPILFPLTRIVASNLKNDFSSVWTIFSTAFSILDNPPKLKQKI